MPRRAGRQFYRYSDAGRALQPSNVAQISGIQRCRNHDNGSVYWSDDSDLQSVGAQDVGMSEPEWQDLQHSGIFEYVSPAWYDDDNLTGSCQPARVSLLIVAPDYFAVIGVKPELGRTFPPADHSPGFTEEVVISDGLWSEHSEVIQTFSARASEWTQTCTASSASCRRIFTILELP